MDLHADQILLTGAAGWLGTGLVQALAHGLPEVPELASPQPGLRVRALVLPTDDLGQITKIHPDLELVRGDVRDPASAQKLCAGARNAVLIHTAGIIHPRRVREFYDINVEGTKHLLAAAAAAGVRRAVIVSSNSPCGCNPTPADRFDERSPYRPYMHYGRSKMQMEQAVEAAGRSGSLETVVIRAPWFYGPFQPPRQTLFFRMIRDGKAPLVGDGQNVRSMAYIDNLAQGLLLAASRPNAAGQTYWIADERPYAMCEILDTVERVLEQDFQVPCAHRRMRLPGFASEVAWLVDKSLQSVGLYHQKIHVLSEMNKSIACSVDRAQRELGFRPTVALEEGMRRSLRWLRDTPNWPF
jgi:nucleoside-diphosphate-sugar epimerase